MRLLLVNKFLRPFGGAESVFFNQWRWLEERGHTVVPFGVAHPDNPHSTYADFWLPAVDYERPTIRQIAGLFWSADAAERLGRLVRETRPEVALLHNIYHQLSPSILRVLQDAGIPAVMVVHDYKLICPNYRLYTQGAVCTRCVDSHTWHALRHRCQRGSLAASLLVAAESGLHRRMGAYDGLRLLIAPSQYLQEMLLRGGWADEKIALLPHAIPLPPTPAEATDRAGVLLVGRLVPEKGGETLLRAAAALTDIAFTVIGDGPQTAAWRRAAPINVRFLGHLPPAEVDRHYAQARVVVVPSLWPELFGLTALEAMAHGAPVVASDSGGLSEVVAHGETGLIVPPGDAPALTAALRQLTGDPDRAEQLGQAGRRRAAERHDPGQYMTSLLTHLRYARGAV